MVDEYVSGHQLLPDVKDTVTELNEVHHVPKAVIAGNFVLYAFPKSAEEFKKVMQMLTELVKDTTVLDKELEESYVFTEVS